MTFLLRFCKCLINESRPGIKAHTFMQSRAAGHAKWQNIKSTKQANDLAKGKMISRFVLQVRRAVVTGGMQGDPKLNRKLADVLAEAQKCNVPKATLDRAVARATNLKIITTNLELQGAEGFTMIAKCETENVGLMKREIRKLVKKFDVSLVAEDTLINMFMSKGFVRTGLKTLDGRDIDENFAEDAAILSNAQEVTKEPYDDSTDAWVFATDAATINQCRNELEKQGFVIMSSELDLVPYREVDFGLSVAEKVIELQRLLRDQDQVVDVYHNVAIPKD